MVTTPTPTPTRTEPTTAPGIVPDPKPTRYSPSPDHYPSQITRTVRRIRRVVDPDTEY